MTSERAEAYGRVMHHLTELSGTKLQPTEVDRIREAADTLLFCEDSRSEEARTATHEAEALVEHLIDVERFTEERGHQLLRDLGECGPLAPVL